MMPQPELPAISAGDSSPFAPNFPQPESAGDSRPMLELFRRHLMPAAGKRCHIQDCTPFRFRCRQSGSRCVLQYTLRVVEPSSGRQWDQWVACLAYARAGEAERLWREVGDPDPQRGGPEGWARVEAVGCIVG